MGDVITYDPTLWTGRPLYAPDLAQLLRWKLINLLYPSFDCECCVGQCPSQGCYCTYHGGVAPNCGPEKWRVLLRRVTRLKP